MKKISMILMVVIFMFSFAFVSAKTSVLGTIYDENLVSVGNASVTVDCYHGSAVNSQSVFSGDDGEYRVEYSETGSDGCNNGDNVIVTAVKGSLSGQKSDVVKENYIGTLDVAMVNIIIVPEFGFVIGMLTILSAVGIFFVARKD